MHMKRGNFMGKAADAKSKNSSKFRLMSEFEDKKKVFSSRRAGSIRNYINEKNKSREKSLKKSKLVVRSSRVISNR